MSYIFFLYRGRVSEKFESSLKRLKVPCKVISTLKKLKMDLSNLKPRIEKCFKSRVVYKICCSRCSFVLCRLNEPSCYHSSQGTQKIWPYGKSHFKECDVEISMDSLSILCITSTFYLMALEAIMINKLTPALNTKD